MASEISDYLANSILAFVKGTTMPAAPAAVYVALYNTNPGPAGVSGSDVTSTIRTAGRVAATFGAVSARAMANSADVDFGVSAGATTVNYFGLWTAQSGGNFLGGDVVDAGRAIVAGDPVKIQTGDLKFNFV